MPDYDGRRTSIGIGELVVLSQSRARPLEFALTTEVSRP
jgi:hypothetical protein